MPAGRFSCVEHFHRTDAGRDYLAVGKADPLTEVWIEQLVADGPVRGFVLAPVRVDLTGDFGG
jgi:hypothetical protein